MRVWIVTHETHHEASTIEGAFSTEALAIERMRELTRDYSVTRRDSLWREGGSYEVALHAERESLVVTEVELDAGC